MKKLITLITLALTVSVASAQKLDSLHTVINNELKQRAAGLETQISSVSSELSASETKQKNELNKLRSETNTQLTTSLGTLKNELREELSKEVSSLQSTIKKERNKTRALNDSIALLKAQITGGLTMIDSEVDGLSSSLTETKQELGAVKENGDLNNKTTHEYLMYLMAAIGVLLLLVMVVYWLTHKKHGSVSSDLVDAKADLKAQINTANADFAEKLAKTLSELPKPGEGGDSAPSPADNQGLILDFAQQIASMENNIWHLPEDDRVRKRIEKATQKMRNTFKSLGYDMPNLLGTEILDGQAVDIGDSNEDSSIEPGKKVVSKVVKPQVLFNGKTIQRPKFDIIENTED